MALHYRKRGDVWHCRGRSGSVAGPSPFVNSPPAAPPKLTPKRSALQKKPVSEPNSSPPAALWNVADGHRP